MAHPVPLCGALCTNVHGDASRRTRRAGARPTRWGRCRNATARSGSPGAPLRGAVRLRARRRFASHAPAGAGLTNGCSLSRCDSRRVRLGSPGAPLGARCAAHTATLHASLAPPARLAALAALRAPPTAPPRPRRLCCTPTERHIADASWLSEFSRTNANIYTVANSVLPCWCMIGARVEERRGISPLRG